MKKTSKVLSLLLALTMILVLFAGCGDTEEEVSVTTATPAGEETSSETEATETEEEATYTWNEYLAAMPDNWNVHSWETNADSYVFGYTESPLVDIIYTVDDDGTEGWDWCYEMATDIEDITATWDQDDEWGIDPSETGRVWKITLNPDAVWADDASTPINADTYIYSMQQCLNPDMKKYSANSYY